MQQIKIDFDNPGLPQRLDVVENDAQSRFFKAVLYKDGKAYAAPSGATYSIIYRGFGPQNEGWYDTINDGAGKRAACSVSGNVVTCEIARQALRVPGHVSVMLCVTGSNGYMLHGWPIDCNCRNDDYTGGTSVESFFYITQVTNADWTSAIQTWEELKNMIDPTLSLSGKAADAAKVGEAVGELKEDLTDFSKLYENTISISDFEVGNAELTSSGLVYVENTKRIRTREGRLLHIEAGTKIALKNPDKYQILIIWADQKIRVGWTPVYYVPVSGDYVLVITTINEKPDMTVIEAYTQLVIENDSEIRFNGFNLLRGDITENGILVYKENGVVTKNSLKIKAGSCFFGVGTGKNQIQITELDNNGMFLKYHEHTDFYLFSSDANVFLRFKHIENNKEIPVFYGNFDRHFCVAYKTTTPVKKMSHYAFGGFSRYSNGMDLSATLAYRESLPSSAAATIVTQNRKTIGIDFSSNLLNIFGGLLSDMYNYELINKLDYIIITHFHSDHCGALKSLINDWNVDISNSIAILPQLLTADNTAQLTKEDIDDILPMQTEVLEILNAANCTILHPTEGQGISVDNVFLKFFNTSYVPYMTSGSQYYSTNYNDYSMGVEVTDGCIVTTYTGDIAKQAQSYLSSKMLRANVMTAPHHGWDGAPENLIPNFINNICPQIVISQNGTEHMPGKPPSIDGDGSPLQKWCEKNGVPNYATYENGTLAVTCDGSTTCLDRPYLKHVSQ